MHQGPARSSLAELEVSPKSRIPFFGVRFKLGPVSPTVPRNTWAQLCWAIGKLTSGAFSQPFQRDLAVFEWGRSALAALQGSPRDHLAAVARVDLRRPSRDKLRSTFRLVRVDPNSKFDPKSFVGHSDHVCGVAHIEPGRPASARHLSPPYSKQYAEMLKHCEMNSKRRMR